MRQNRWWGAYGFPPPRPSPKDGDGRTPIQPRDPPRPPYRHLGDPPLHRPRGADCSIPRPDPAPRAGGPDAPACRDVLGGRGLHAPLPAVGQGVPWTSPVAVPRLARLPGPGRVPARSVRRLGLV